MTEAPFIGEGGGVKPQIELVRNEAEGTDLAKKVIYQNCDIKTVLFLSGGKTPKALYEALAKERKLVIGAAAMVDDRYSVDFTHSNEPMIRQTGLVDFLDRERIPFYPVLHSELNEATRREADNDSFIPRMVKMTRTKASEAYNRQVQRLFERFRKGVAVLGLGNDGHTAGIAPNRPDFKNPLFSPSRTGLLVSDFRDPKPMSSEGSPEPPHGFGERITLTLHGLSKMDLLILMVFGEGKRKGLEKIMKNGAVEKAPARFLMTGEMAQKTILITDQKI